MSSAGPPIEELSGSRHAVEGACLYYLLVDPGVGISPWKILVQVKQGDGIAAYRLAVLVILKVECLA